MKLSLQSYFDLGLSFGLGDEVFSQSTLAPDISAIGISNPLGQGILYDLKTQAPEIVRIWKEKAKEKVTFWRWNWVMWQRRMGPGRQKIWRPLF